MFVCWKFLQLIERERRTLLQCKLQVLAYIDICLGRMTTIDVIFPQRFFRQKSRQPSQKYLQLDSGFRHFHKNQCKLGEQFVKINSPVFAGICRIFRYLILRYSKNYFLVNLFHLILLACKSFNELQLRKFNFKQSKEWLF